MPDRWGRTNMQDGLNILGAVRTMQGIGDANRRKEHETKRDDYLNRMSKNEKIDPGEKGYRYASHLDAEAIIRQKQFGDESYRQQKLQTEAAQRQQNQADIDKRIATADFYEKQSEVKAAENLYSIYNYLPDGQTYEGIQPGSGGAKLLMRDQQDNPY
ncbi:MAG: hypothetical protein GY852_09350, partial [bacterium]|nr:hypothetical protein [bacterium]